MDGSGDVSVCSWTGASARNSGTPSLDLALRVFTFRSERDRRAPCLKKP